MGKNSIFNMLENEKIKLRAVEPDDLKRLYDWENDTELWSLGSTIAPYSKYVLREFIKNADKDIFTTKQLRLMIDNKQDNKTVGCVDLHDFDFFNQRVALGLLIDKNYRQKGFAFDTVEVIINYCFSFLKLRQIYCYIPANNERSIKLFQKVGFLQNGILKDWMKTENDFCDVFVFQKIRLS